MNGTARHFVIEIPHRCEEGVSNPGNIDNGGVSACGEPAAYRVWWGAQDNGLCVCRQHLQELEVGEECDYEVLHRCQWDVTAEYTSSGYVECGEPACYLVRWSDGDEQWLCEEHVHELEKLDGAAEAMEVTDRLDRAGFCNYEVHDGFIFLPLRGQSSLLERIRRGLANARIEHDDWDWIAEEVLRSLGE